VFQKTKQKSRTLLILTVLIVTFVLVAPVAVALEVCEATADAVDRGEDVKLCHFWFDSMDPLNGR